MRKSFTRLFSIFILLTLMSFQALLAQVANPTLSPATGFNNVEPNASGVTFTLTFAENVYAGSAGAGVIALSNSADVQLDPIQVSGTTSTNPITGSTVVIDGKKVFVTFKTALTEKATYYITATPNAIMNGSGQYWTGLRSIAGGVHDYVFIVGDFTKPVVENTNGLTPADNSTAVPSNQVFIVDFTENVQPGTGLIQIGDAASKPGNIGLYKENGDVVELFDVNATITGTGAPGEGQVDILNDKLYINPTNAGITELQKYYLRILPTAITDVSVELNTYDGINNNIDWSFQAADLTPPSVAFTPNGGTNIQQGQTMKFTFSDNRTGAGLTFNLKKVTAGTAPVATTVAAIAINENVQGRVSFEEDADGAGAGGYVAVPTANYTAKYTAANEITIAFTGTNKFKTGAKYRLGVVANQLADDEKNVVAAVTKEFTAGDFTPPAVGTVYAEAGGYGAGHAANFSANATANDKNSTKIYFGLQTNDVDGTSNVSTYPTAVKYLVTTSTTVPAVNDVLAGTTLPLITNQTSKHEAYITVDKNNVALASNTTYRIYYVMTDNATVKNTSAVQTAVVTTNDIIAPTYTVDYKLGTTSNPSTAVDKQGKIVITFNEDVASDAAGTLFTVGTFGAAVQLKYLGTSPATTLAYGVGYTVTKVSDKVFEINGTHSNWGSANWMSLGDYSVKILDNKVYDLAGQDPPYGTANPITGASTHNFTIKDYEGPTVDFAPAHGATSVNNSADITITFSETPYYGGAPVTNTNISSLVELRKGGATSDPLVPRTVTISGNVVTIVPTTKPLDSEQQYRASVSTDITDVNGYKLDRYSDNTTPIGAEQEYAVFTTNDNRTPIISFTTINAGNAEVGLVSVPNDARPKIKLDEGVREVASNTAIAALDPNMVRTLITLKKDDASGVDVEFNVTVATVGLTTEIIIDPIDYPSTFLFSNGGTYYVAMTGIEDAADNAVSGSATFTIANTTPLTFTVSPSNGASGIAKNGNVVLTFNQNLRKETTSGVYNITINDGGAGADFSIDVTNVAVIVSGNQVTIPYTGLDQDLTYTLTIPANAFIALANNLTSGASVTTFKTVDETGPYIDFGSASNLVNPDELGPLVPISGGQLTMLFDEDISLGTGLILLRKPELGGATTIYPINVQSNYVTVDGTNHKLVKIDIPVVLDYNQAYFLEIPQTAFKDAAGNNFRWEDSDDAPGTINTNTDVTAPASLATYSLGDATWDFQTALDATPTLNLAGFVPAVNANDVDADAGLTITFSEPVTLAGSGLREVTIFRSSDNTNLQTVDLSTTALVWNSSTSVTVPHLSFEANKAYYVNISPNAFVDATGNPVGGLTSTAATGWYFTTQDLTLPTATLTTAGGEALSAVTLADNLILTFSEPISLNAASWAAGITLSTGTFAASLASDNKTLTINPTNNFSSLTGATLTLNLNAVKDASGNLNAATVYNLTGEDKTAPNWVGAYPLAVTPYSSTKAKFQVQLDEPATVYYLLVANNTYSSAPSNTIVKGGSTYNYTPASSIKDIEIPGLSEFTAYDVWVVAVDQFGNETTPAKKVDLNTTDVTNPYVVTGGLTPSNGQVDVNYNHVSPVVNGLKLSIKFNETVQFSANVAKLVVRRYDNNVKVFEADKNGTVGAPAGGTLALANSSTSTTNDVLTVTIPASQLADKTQYYVEFEYDMLTDAKNQTIGAANLPYLDAFIGKADWSFVTADETLPFLVAPSGSTALIPNDGATNVAVEASNSLKLRFNEPIAKGTGFIYIYIAGNAAPQEIINVTGTDVVVNPSNSKELIINRYNAFASETVYRVEIPATAVKDLAPAPNYYVGRGIGGATGTWQFTTLDNTAPVLTALSPTTSTNVALATPMKVQVQNPNSLPVTYAMEQLYLNGVAVTTATDLKAYFTLTENGTAKTITSAPYSQVDHSITVNYALAANKTYVVTFTNKTGTAALTDVHGLALGAFTGSFSTVDLTSPTIAITPVHNSTDVLVGSKVNIKFSRTVYNSTSTNANYNLTPSATDLGTAAYITFREKLTPANTVAYSVEVVTPGLEYNLVPNANLSSTMKYEVIWNANSGSGQEVADAVSGTGITFNRTLAERTSEFTTEDVVKPVVIGGGYAPANNALLASPTTATVLTFSEKVVAGSGTIQIRRGNGQIFYEIPAANCTYKTTTAPWTVTIPHPAFEKFTSYYVIIPAGTFTDASSNHNIYDGILNNLTWTFSTDDGTAPQGEYTPVPGTSDIPVYSDLMIQFDENIVAGAGNLVIYYDNGDTGYDGNAIEIIPIGSPLVSITGTDVANNFTSDIMTINPATTFDKLGTFYIRIDAGFVKDVAGNNFAGISDNTTWSFTVTDNTKPNLILSSLSPAQNATGIESEPTLSMTFDRDVLAGLGEIKLFKYYYVPENYAYEEMLIEPIDVNSTQVDISGTTVTIDPSVVLEDNTIYYVLIGNTVFTNTASSHDQWGGIASPFTWRFTTGDNTAPTVSADLVDGTGDLANDFDVTLTFDEAVVGADETTITATGGTINGITETVTGVEYVVSVTADDLASVVLTVDGTIADASGNLLAETVFNYSVADNNGPTMTATPDMGTDLPSTFTVTLEFSEDVTGVADAVSVDGGDATVTEVSATEYTVEIVSTDGAVVTLDVANTVVDAADNALVGTYSYTYNIVADGTAPEVSADPDSSEGMPNSFSVDVIFTEPVNDAATDIEVDGATSYTVVGIDGDAIYTVEITADDLATVTITVPTTVTDIAGNALAADAVFTYTVADHAAPTITALSPESGADDLVAAEQIDLVMTFDEDVVAGAGSVTIYLGSGVRVEYGIADAVVSGNTVTISMDVDDLLHNQTYFVYVDNGFVTDEAGNAFAGITSPATWVFSTVLDTKTIELVSGSLKVYPNPCTSSVTVESTNGGIISRAVFTNVAGQIVKDIAVDGVSKTISTSNLRSGIYFVSLYDGKVIAKTERIVKR